jgi:8-oxo-dGTP pyrophosphatase MutT (NUDIX family)
MIIPDGLLPTEIPDPPATAKDAATVVLARDRVDEHGGTTIEVFLLQRVAGMAFAGGMTVFPGGGVDQRDADSRIDVDAWHGPDAQWWADRFDCAPATARALVCAAVRETFEESGVLLAGPDATSVISDSTPYASARQALVNRELSLAQFLTDAGLVLRADLLAPWGNWITPEVEPRRYDTRFFLAALPSGQRADGFTTEADHAQWRRPEQAIQEWKNGVRGLLPPTWTTLSELAKYESVAEAMAEDRSIDRIMPKVIRRDGALHLLLPGDEGYDSAPTHLEPNPGDRLERR